MANGLRVGLLQGADTALGRRVDNRSARQDQERQLAAQEAQRQQELAMKLQLSLAQGGVDSPAPNDIGAMIRSVAELARNSQTQSQVDEAQNAVSALRLKMAEQGLLSEDGDQTQEGLLSQLSSGVSARKGAESDAKSAKADADLRNTESIIANREKPKPVDPTLALRMQKLNLDIAKAEREAAEGPEVDEVRPSAGALKAISEAGDQARALALEEIASGVEVPVGGILGFGREKPLSLATKRTQAEKEAALFAGQPEEIVTEWREMLDKAQSDGMDKAQEDLAERGFSPKAPGLSAFHEGETAAIPQRLIGVLDQITDPASRDRVNAFIQQELALGKTEDEIIAALRQTQGG